MALILIVDDETSITATLANVLSDAGHQTISCGSGEELPGLMKQKPDLVLLDIWLPGKDGISCLKELAISHPAIPIIMMSGHATISTAVAATKLGAVDFIEKPFDLKILLAAVERALKHTTTSPTNRTQSVKPFAEIFSDNLYPGRNIGQRTIASSAILYGQGLHSGTKSGLILEPLPLNSGIHFIGVYDNESLPAYINNVESTGFSTTIKSGQTRVATIEHLMSALHAFKISNVLIKCNGEVPVMDGSAAEFCNLISNTGITEQGGVWHELAVTSRFSIVHGQEHLEISPAADFSIEYKLNYPQPVGEQSFSFTLKSPEEYIKHIAPARTFGFVKDIRHLQSQGLALGGRFDNFVLFGEGGSINTQLRFSDEPARHKILDLIGDLYLLGRPIVGHVTAFMTGHSDNVALLQQIISSNVRKDF